MRKFGKLYTHSFGSDTQHDYSQGNCRTMSSIIINEQFMYTLIKLYSLHENLAYIWWLKCIKNTLCILNLFLSKQLTIKKCTLLDCTNTEIIMYCIYIYNTRLRFVITYTHSFGTDTQTWRFRPLAEKGLDITDDCTELILSLPLNLGFSATENLHFRIIKRPKKSCVHDRRLIQPLNN